MRLFRLVLLFLFCTNAHTAEITGTVEVIDGDRIRIAETDIRLHGIDAPEVKQSCIYRGEDWSCGAMARDALKQIIGNAAVRCVWEDLDVDDYALATCTREGYDIAELMVDNGLAMAYTKYTGKYLPDEEQAKKVRKGMWAAQFVKPWDWRRGIRLAGNELPDADCPVKGDVNSNGEKIYHVKGWRDHLKIALNDAEGDRCFLSVDEALLAGFTLPAYAREK